MVAIQLREYQARDIAKIKASFASGKRAPLYVLPTGGGKTFCFAHIAKSAVEKQNHVMILVHRQELLSQASSALKRLGVDHGIIAPAFVSSKSLVQVASVQTVVRRTDRVNAPNLIIVDESHHATSPTYRKILAAFPKSAVLGVTATPARMDGQGLGVNSGGLFDDMILGPSIDELINQGYLVRPTVYAPPVGIDLRGVHRRYGDYDKKELTLKIDKPKITGDAIEHYKRICPGTPAIAFCVSVSHAEHVASEFRSAGIRAVRVDGKLSDNARRAAIRGLGDGSVEILTSADLIGEGVDIPRVGAVIGLRPTESLPLYLQQVGRALRPYPGKTQAIVLDHVGNTLKHGFPDDPRMWQLDPDVNGSKHGGDDALPAVHILQCEKCYHVFEKGPDACPLCGEPRPQKLRSIEEVEGELKQLAREEVERMRREGFKSKRREEGRAQTLEDFQAIANARGYKPGWARMRFELSKRRKKYGSN